MTEKGNLNSVRGRALARIDKSQRNFKLFLYSALIVETLFFIVFLLKADLHNTTHLLLFLATIAIYVILGLGLFALGAHVSRNTQLVLKAIELLEERVEAARR
jgi:L-asparagine transporter-like permease